MRRTLCAIVLLLLVLFPGLSHASCVVQSGTTYAAGTYLSSGICDTFGNLKETLGTTLAGEDTVNNVLKTEQRFTYSGNKTADTLVKSGPGFVHHLVCIGTDAAATAGTVILYDNTAESGTVIFSWAVQASAYPQPVVIPLDVVFGTGLYLGFTTTADITCTVSYR